MNGFGETDTVSQDAQTMRVYGTNYGRLYSCVFLHSLRATIVPSPAKTIKCGCSIILEYYSSKLSLPLSAPRACNADPLPSCMSVAEFIYKMRNLITLLA